MGVIFPVDLMPFNEEVYLKSYDSVTEARQSMKNYINFYNMGWPHSSLEGIPPDMFYYQHLP
jgi:putative transposase